MNIRHSLFCVSILGVLGLAAATHAADSAGPMASQRLGTEHAAAQDACLAAVAKSANVEVAKLDIIAVQSVDGITVSIRVPDTKKPWTCHSDEEGNVKSASAGES